MQGSVKTNNSENTRRHIQKVAWIGTGVMGAPMARHLAEAGYQVSVFNRSPQKAEALSDCARVCQTIADAVCEADAVFTIVGFETDVASVYLGADGILTHAPKGALLCDMTTSSPDLARRIAKEAQALGLHALDAPVTGGDLGAKNASLSIMVGGEKEDYDLLLPLFQKLGKSVCYMGASGSGQDMKLANQLAIAGALAGICEALSYAKSKGLDLMSVHQVINHGSAHSWQGEHNGAKMIEDDMQPGFFLKHFIKDLRLGQENAGTLQLPIGQKVLEMCQALAEKGFGDSGTQVLFKAYDEE